MACSFQIKGMRMKRFHKRHYDIFKSLKSFISRFWGRWLLEKPQDVVVPRFEESKTLDAGGHPQSRNDPAEIVSRPPISPLARPRPS